MTYEESYMQCESIEELEKKVITDIKIAQWFNSDRLPIIKKAAEKVANEKFGEVNRNEMLVQNKRKMVRTCTPKRILHDNGMY